MRRSRTAPLLTVAAILIVAVVILALLFGGFGAKTAEVHLPDTPADAGDTPDSPAAEGWLRADVTPETVQAVVATLVRPDSYSRRLSVTRSWDGGSRTEQVSVWQKSGMLKVTIDGGEPETVKNILFYEGSLRIWYGSDSQHVYRYDGGDAALGDSLQQLPTYEDLLALDPADILTAGYIRHGGGWRIMATVLAGEGCLEVYYISTETGLLEAAERWENSRLVYSMTAGEADLSAPNDAVFLLGAPQPR